MKKPIDEDTFEVFHELKKAFRIAMAQTRATISELKNEADPELKKQARVEYLKDRMSDLIIETWELMDRYEDYYRRDFVIERLLTGEKLQALVKEIVKHQGEIISLKHNGAGRISEIDTIQAKAHPFTDLLEFRNKQTLCPFHSDKDPSMHFYPDSNTVHCFSCNKSWDTIGFIMERDNLSFVGAVRWLI